MEKHKHDKESQNEEVKKIKQDFLEKIKPSLKPKYVELEEQFKR